MLQIDIVGFDGDNLKLEVNGHSNNGRSSPTRDEEVQWKVRPNKGIKSIEAIAMKNIAGSDNVFSSDPPRSINAQKMKWRAKTNNNAEDGAVYVYNIEWVKDGDPTIRTYDPIISIRPVKLTSDNFLYNVVLTTAVVTTLLAVTLAVMLYFSKQENFRLKNIDQITEPAR